MFVDSLSQFISYLTERERHIEEILAHLTLRTFEDVGCTGVLLADIRNDGILEVTSKYGLPTDFFDSHPRAVNLTDHMPMADSISRRETIWITTLPSWGDGYEKLSNLNYPYQDKTFICWPIEQSGKPCASIGIFCKDEVNPDVELDSFLKAVSNALSLYFFRPHKKEKIFRIASRRKNRRENGSNHSELTERQLVILKMISEASTNIAIAQALGYSESTIRQETMKIYSKLGCMGRAEAATIYRERYAHSLEESRR